jgi:hypothetical protein
MNGCPAVRRYQAILLLAVLSIPGHAARQDVGLFSSGTLSGWQEKSFEGRTHYKLETLDGREALYASSRGSASGLYREISVDLERTPFLYWSWRVESLIQGNDERAKSGDDYPARVYVIFSGGFYFWRTRAINYVWSSNQEAGSEWPNAFTANAGMIAVRAGDSDLGQWVTEKRDIRADYRRLFNEEPGKIAAIAIMTDTDNTGQAVQAWYGDIWLAGQ